MEEFRVRVRATGVVRTVTRQAYMAMGPKVYEKLGPAEAEPPQEVVRTEGVYRSVSAPVIHKQIPEVEHGKGAPAESVEVKVKGKPGRKPGYKKSISSNSTEDEK